IEMFYNPKRKHANNGMLSPVDFEIRQQKPNQARVKETRGTSDKGIRLGIPSRKQRKTAEKHDKRR
ncbi:hypothetical protein, partial [Sedimentitalea arenosa]|uniref:hypothetical protein n=1 Tax=Sedimentitalea arenosa TaxID=2798803 RepID=UPI001E2E0E57